MAWVMARDGVAGKIGHQAEFKSKESQDLGKKQQKPDVMLEYFDPESSPTWVALAHGSSTFQPPHDAHWQCVLEYSRAHRSITIHK
eukprot:5859461-Pyramimonas_sp.AAC.1